MAKATTDTKRMTLYEWAHTAGCAAAIKAVPEDDAIALATFPTTIDESVTFPTTIDESVRESAVQIQMAYHAYICAFIDNLVDSE